MKKYTHTLFLLFLLAGTGSAQVSSTHFCASSVFLQNSMAADPAHVNRHNDFEDIMYSKLADSITQAGNRAIYYIPVVVHIIHNLGPENISNAQVLAGIDDLNNAFANTGFYNEADGVDAGIQFCLAKRDEDGNATSGINRVQSTLTNFTMETEDAALKALIVWDPTKYLNIWIVNDINSISVGPYVVGYATFPSSHGMPNDGIVNEASFFGSTHDNSKIHVHEAGHYLGLYHTFEGGCSNNNCMLENDRVCDTPPDGSTAAVPCSGSVNTCTTDDDDLSAANPFRPVSAGGLGDQNDYFFNYMDYGTPACQHSFTAGQKTRMINSLLFPRNSLLTSGGCTDPCTSGLSASFTPSGTSVPAGTTVSFTNTSSGSTGYSWKVNSTVFSSATSPSYTFTSPGVYNITLVGTNADPNCTDSSTITITVTCPVLAGFIPSATSIPAGGSVTFTNTSTGAVTYNWYINGVLTATTSSPVFPFADEGQYIVYMEASSPYCSDLSGTVIISVGTSCDAVTASVLSPVCVGDTLALQVTGTTSSSTYHWTGGGTFLPSASISNPQYIPSAGENAAGHVELLLETTVPGSVTGVGAALLGYDHMGDDFIFHMDPVTGVTTNLTPDDGMDWTAMGYDIDDQLLYGFPNIVASPALYVMDMSVTPPVSTHITPMSQRFYGADYDNTHQILYAVGVPYSGSGVPQTLYKVNTTTGALTTIGDLGLPCGFDIFHATGNGINGLAYDPTGDVLFGVSENGKLYKISVTTGAATLVGNTVLDLRGLTYDFIENKLYGISVTATLYEIDKTSGLTVATTMPSGSYSVVTSLTFAPESTTGSTSVTCYDSVSVDLFPLPVVDLGVDSFYCTQSSVLLDAGTGHTSYLWNDFSTGQFLTASSVGPYHVTVTDINGCANSDTVNITGLITPITPVNLGPDITVCAGEIKYFDAGPGYEGYLWNSIFDGQGYTAYQPGIYWVTVSDNCNNKSTDSVRVNWTQPPPQPTINDTGFCVVPVEIGTTAINGYTYHWSNGSNGPTTTAEAPGEYLLTISNNGCNTRVSVIVIDENCECAVDVPTAFSPNDDGLNDCIKPLGSCISKMTFVIFDRYGERIFETYDPGACWDGVYKGNRLSSQVFGYNLRVEMITGEIVTKTGNITLMR